MASLGVRFGDDKGMPCRFWISVLARQEYLLQAGAEDYHGARETTDRYAPRVGRGGKEFK